MSEVSMAVQNLGEAASYFSSLSPQSDSETTMSINTHTGGNIPLQSTVLIGGCYQNSDYHLSWYPSYWYQAPDKTAQAFRILNVLIKKKILTINSVAKFVTVVDEIAQVL